MNTLKSLVDSVISDLTENKSIESILLKTEVSQVNKYQLACL